MACSSARRSPRPSMTQPKSTMKFTLFSPPWNPKNQNIPFSPLTFSVLFRTFLLKPSRAEPGFPPYLDPNVAQLNGEPPKFGESYYVLSLSLLSLQVWTKATCRKNHGGL